MLRKIIHYNFSGNQQFVNLFTIRIFLYTLEKLLTLGKASKFA